MTALLEARLLMRSRYFKIKLKVLWNWESKGSIMAQKSSDVTFGNATEGAKLVGANVQFALDLYRHLSLTTPGNIFMSPLSISIALAMTYHGARNNTKSQMSSVMHFGDVSETDLHQLFSEIRLALNKPGQPFKLFTANRLFGEKSYNFLDEYLHSSEKYYGAKLEPVNFSGDPNGAADIINKWVAENTNDTIKEILPPGVVNTLTRLILVNAIYFKGNWMQKFDPAKTELQDFYVTDNETVQVQLMYKPKSKFNYGASHELVCQAIELPYVDGKLSMIILLPDPTTTLAKVESSLTVEDLINVNQKFHMSNRDVHVWLPRFKLDEKLGLTEVLSALGMADLFSVQDADLSGIDGARNLFISKVLHRAVVDVNEEGTEAAAATAVVAQMRCLPKDFDFRADRPFIFFIRDNNTKSILFLGRFARPAN